MKIALLHDGIAMMGGVVDDGIGRGYGQEAWGLQLESFKGVKKGGLVSYNSNCKRKFN